MSVTRRLCLLLVLPALLVAQAAVTAQGGSDREPRFVAALGASTSVGYSATTQSGPEPANSWAWARTPAQLERGTPSIRIVDVRPLRTSDQALRDFVTHVLTVRVAITGWSLLPYQPGATARENRARAGHWRLYLDGHSLGDNYGRSTVSYTPYVTPGTHWLAAELSNADASSLRPAVWSEPVVLHVPRVVRCWQSGWHGSPERGTARFTCDRHGTGRDA